MVLNSINSYQKTIELAKGLKGITDLKNFGTFLQNRYGSALNAGLESVGLTASVTTQSQRTVRDIGCDDEVGGTVIMVKASTWTMKGGSKLKAKDVFANVNNFIMEAGVNQTQTSSSSSINFGFAGPDSFLPINLSVSGSEYQSVERVHVPSMIIADRMMGKFGKAHISGSQIRARLLDMIVKHDLKIESILDSLEETGHSFHISTSEILAAG